MVSCCICDCDVTYCNNPAMRSFHRLPVDPTVRQKWIRIIARPNWIPTKYSTVCSKHFEEKYVRKRNSNTILTKGAIPTLFVPVQLKHVRVATSYVNQDISPPPSPSSGHKEEVQVTARKNLTKYSKLKQKMIEKQRRIRSLTAKSKRQAQKIVSLQDVLKEIHSRSGLKDHYNDITMSCNNELIQNLINRVNDDMCTVRP